MYPKILHRVRNEKVFGVLHVTTVTEYFVEVISGSGYRRLKLMK